jgi:hypothetical protein
MAATAFLSLLECQRDVYELRKWRREFVVTGLDFYQYDFVLPFKSFFLAPFFVLGCPAERAILWAWHFWRWKGRKKIDGGNTFILLFCAKDEMRGREKKITEGI